MRASYGAAILGCLSAIACSDEPTPDAGPAPDASVEAGPADASRPDAGPSLPAPPASLSVAGLYRGEVGGPLADGVRSYDVRHPLWTDGLEKRRHLLLPPGGTIDTSDPDHWAFPEGTRLFKEFLLDGQPLETRLLWRAGPGPDDWVYVAYRFRADGTDADPVPDGALDVLGTSHDVPSTADCRNCHRGGGDFVLGVGAYQLDRASFDAWVADGALPAAAVYAEVPGDEVQRAALGYLHGNCGHCHGELHPLSMHRTLRLGLPVGLERAEDAPAWSTAVGLEAMHLIEDTRFVLVPGDPAASQLYARMGVRGDLGMPPTGTEQIDPAGRAAVAAWIVSGP